MRVRTFFIFFFILSFSSQSQQKTEKPKLVVGIVVDQMRYDYLYRFYDKFQEDGFKRLLTRGFECKNHHFNYMPTYTGPGHASIYTGTTPENHGIIANNWYDKFHNKMIYCVNDDSVMPLGTSSNSEKMSPHRMLSTSFADANRLHTQFKGKTIGISIKDRGAVLPAGHTANRAYWFRGKNEGQWVSTSYYGPQLPTWVKAYNKQQPAKKYLKIWETLYPIEKYIESGADLNNYEKGYKGKATATFPYDLKKLSKANGGYDIIKSTPYGNNLVTDFAIAALKNEQLGVDNHTDVLAISYSSTDYVGHNFGVNSIEIEDTYLRLDQEIAKLLKTLDQQVGKGQYTLFLTADHGAVHVPQFLDDHKIPAHYFNRRNFKNKVEKFLIEKFKIEGIIKNWSNQQLFINYKKLAQNNISLQKVTASVSHFISQQAYIQHVFTREGLIERNKTSVIGKLIQNGFHQRLSGDIAYVFNPATIAYGKKGSTHGSPQAYDTHVPLIFFGKGIKEGKTYKRTSVIDIAPTISALLEIAIPNGTTGNVLSFVYQ